MWPDGTNLSADSVLPARCCEPLGGASVLASRPCDLAHSRCGNGAVTDFYRAVKSVGGIVQAKELLANIEAFQNA